jgi:hypothetical protein
MEGNDYGVIEILSRGLPEETEAKDEGPLSR